MEQPSIAPERGGHIVLEITLLTYFTFRKHINKIVIVRLYTDG